ncbi:GNAT family N-acetyltransferase [Blautia sp. HCP3S3_H10_1]|uniref:GNAT family N-acetyltransferase n=1 Tax=unclassified Blautia TaxID=2648079 RepID=UPI003F919176
MKDDNEEIYLRPIEYGDIDLIVKWRNSEDVKKYFIFQGSLTKKSQEEWIDTKVKTKEVYQFIIVIKKLEKPIGSVYLRDVDINHGKAEFGIFIGERSYWGNGYGTIATKKILDFAFRELKLHRIYLRVYSDNQRAINSYKKVGFKVEGLLKEDVYVREKYRDITWMGMLRSNWTKFSEK